MPNSLGICCCASCRQRKQALPFGEALQIVHQPLSAKNTNGSHHCPSATIFLFTQEQSAFVRHVIFCEKFAHHAKMLRLKCTTVGKQLQDVSTIGVTNPHSLIWANAWLLEKARVRGVHLTLCSVVFSTIHTFELQNSNL